MSRSIIIGDVHGCLEELDELLKLVSYRPGEDLGFVGDLVDRGPDSLGAVRRVKELAAWVTMGNHDEKHVRYRKHEIERAVTGKKNPMQAFYPARQAEHDRLTDSDVAWMSAFPMMRLLNPLLVVVHAGLEPGVPLEKQKASVCTRLRYLDERDKMASLEPGNPGAPAGTVQWATRWRGPGKVIYGHHVLDTKNVTMNVQESTFGIDTGCCFGGRLTAMVLTVMEKSGFVYEFAQVDARREYAKLWTEGEQP